MNTTQATLAAVLLAVGVHTPLIAAPAKETGAGGDPDHARLVAARKAAEQQAKADRALTTKAYAEYKSARKRSNESEAAYRKAYDAALGKIDPAAPGLQEKERAAFRERMLKARTARKSGVKKPEVKDDEADDEPAADEKDAN
jgi:hypothetical protein